MPNALVPAGNTKPWEHSTPKEQRFVDAYMVNGFSAADAFIAAGYSTKSRRNALRANAHQVLRRPHVRAEIDRRMRELTMSKDEALARHSAVGRSDIGECLVDHRVSCPSCGHVLEEEGSLRIDLTKLKQMGLTHLVKRITTFRDGRTSVELYESDAARRDILKAHGAFRSGVEADATSLMGLMAAAAAAARSRREDDPDEIIADYEVDSAESD